MKNLNEHVNFLNEIRATLYILFHVYIAGWISQDVRFCLSEFIKLSIEKQFNIPRGKFIFDWRIKVLPCKVVKFWRT